MNINKYLIFYMLTLMLAIAIEILTTPVLATTIVALIGVILLLNFKNNMSKMTDKYSIQNTILSFFACLLLTFIYVSNIDKYIKDDAILTSTTMFLFLILSLYQPASSFIAAIITKIKI